MTYVGGMSFTKQRKEDINRPRAYGKHKKIRHPTLLLGSKIGAEGAPRARSGAGSEASSPRSSAHKAVEEGTTERTVMLEAEAESQGLLARLASTRVECNEHHQTITVVLK